MNGKNREHLLLVVAGVVIGLFFADRLVFTPLINLWKAQGDRYSELSEDITKGSMLIDRKDALDDRWATMKKESLSENDAEKKLLESISQWAGTSSLQIDSIKPKWQSDEKLGKRLEMRLSATGNIESITRFLYALETSERPIRMENVKIRTRNDTGSQLSLEAQFSGIVLPESST